MINMPHLMKPRLTREDHDSDPIRESQKKDNDKVVKPKDVFVGYKDQKKPKKKKVKSVPKGSHRMPDGSIMKDSDMKKKDKKKTKSKY